MRQSWKPGRLTPVHGPKPEDEEEGKPKGEERLDKRNREEGRKGEKRKEKEKIWETER